MIKYTFIERQSLDPEYTFPLSSPSCLHSFEHNQLHCVPVNVDRGTDMQFLPYLATSLSLSVFLYLYQHALSACRLFSTTKLTKKIICIQIITFCSWTWAFFSETFVCLHSIWSQLNSRIERISRNGGLCSVYGCWYNYFCSTCCFNMLQCLWPIIQLLL